MNQSYKLTVRDPFECCSSSQEHQSSSGLITPYGKQYGANLGLDSPLSLQLSSSSTFRPASSYMYSQHGLSCYSPLRRLQDLTSMVHRPDLGMPERNIHGHNDLHEPSLIGGTEYIAALKDAIPSPGSHGTGDYLAGPGVERTSFAPASPVCQEHTSPITNGCLHFESTLFENGDSKDGEDLPLLKHSLKKDREAKVDDTSTSESPRVDFTASRQDLGLHKTSVAKNMTVHCPPLERCPSPPCDLAHVESWDEDSDSDCEELVSENCSPGFGIAAVGGGPLHDTADHCPSSSEGLRVNPVRLLAHSISSVYPYHFLLSY